MNDLNYVKAVKKSTSNVTIFISIIVLILGIFSLTDLLFNYAEELIIRLMDSINFQLDPNLIEIIILLGSVFYYLILVAIKLLKVRMNRQNRAKLEEAGRISKRMADQLKICPLREDGRGIVEFDS